MPKMDGEEDAWDGPNIRPPQASVPDDRGRQRPSKNRDLYRHDRPQKSSNSQRRDIRRDGQHRDRGRHGEDLRDRLNRPMDHPRGKDRGRDNRRDQKRVDPRRSDHRSTHREGDMGRGNHGNREERDARVKRMLQASMAKEKEMLKRRMLKEKEFQEAEQRIKRKRDRSRDRQVEGKKSRSSPHHARSPVSQQSKNSDDESDGNESGEEESEEGESDSSNGSTDSEADTASEQSGATPDREDSNAEDEENLSGQSDDRDTEGERSDGDESDPRDAELKDLADKADRRKNTTSDHSRTPSRSPTPRKSGEETEDDLNDNEEADEPTENDKHATANEIVKKESDKEYHSSPIHNILDDLPPYLPSVLGCRSVDEFHCLNRIEEGTYGVVYRARDKNTNEIVALKRLKMEREKEGFPITSLREINTLLISQHKNVVHVREIVVGSNMDKIFIVMDFVEHDMKSLMETMRQKNQVFLPGEVKCLMIQLLSAISHLHDNWILHRDLKTSNLLLSHNGILKVGDFGLAREYGSPLKAYTAIVVTLWYRAPELLLGIKEYSTFIDVWSIGCIFGEFLLMNPLFPGKSEVDELNRIFKLLGTPSERIWPGYNQLPAVQKMKFVEYPVSHLRNKFAREMLSDKGLALLKQFLTYDPKQRITCDGALRHAYFDETPLAIDPSMFPTWPAKSELSGPGKKASSPKPPSGGGAFKKINDDDVEARLGFSLNAGNAMPAASSAGWALKF